MSTVAVKEHGLIFSAPLIPRLLDGSKTQTRRIVKQGRNEVGEPADAVCYCSDGTWISWWGKEPKEGWQAVTDFRYPNGGGFRCPYGEVGDSLWVRETWASDRCYDHLSPRDIPRSSKIYYAAKGGDGAALVSGWHKARSSIHMPRWASRITLEITRVRVERIQSISEEDAIAEGIRPLPLQDASDPSAWWESAPGQHQARSAVISFRQLWESIYGKGSWEANSWVWAISFRRIER